MSALWFTGVLVTMWSYSTTLGAECILGMVGQLTLLPCIYDGAADLTSGNVSIEWRKDTEVVYHSVWAEGTVEPWNGSYTNKRVSADAPNTGTFSLELSEVEPRDSHNYSLYLRAPGEELDRLLCTVCLRTAAHFSFPSLQREKSPYGDETHFLCNSRDGFPEPAVHWLINDMAPPPEGSVRTLSIPLPDSHLLNITSILILNISQETSVSCAKENLELAGVLRSSPVRGRAAKSLWMFPTALCVMVGLMVTAALIYQIHIDRKNRNERDQHHNVKENNEEQLSLRS
ncbi:ICOS ligand isoform X2 [Esox lucius]|uniref:ICOS ligand isoform X2 n=1 Tax=Esox lucius TaxID=8010 RepID=UPI0014775F6E|nr:ICOS ligand isoform X2 [Esox lucius]